MEDPVIISIGKSRRDTKWRNTDTTWESLVSKLGAVYRTRETVREYRAMSKEEQGKVKDIGGFVGGRVDGGHRKNENVVDRCLVTLDADNAYPDMWDDLELTWDGELVCYSTHSHAPDKPRLRFVIPLSRTVTPEEYPAVARKLAQKIGIETMDPSTYEPARLMYFPSCPSDGEFFFRHAEGEWINPDDVLAEYGLGDAWKDTTLWPIAKGEQEVRVKEAKHQGEPSEKPGVVGLFCRAYDIETAMDELIPGVYESAGENRFTYVAGSTAAGAVMYDDKFLYSHHGTDPCGGKLVNAFDMVRIHKFGELDSDLDDTNMTERPSYKKMCEFATGLGRVKKQLSEEQSEMLDDLSVGLDEANPSDWVNELELNTKTGKAKPTRKNIRLILENDPRLEGCLRFNEFVQAPVRLRETPWMPDAKLPPGAEISGVLWQDEDDAGLREFFEAQWGIDNTGKMQDAVCLASRRQSFHPVRDYLDSCWKGWDGKPRVDNLLIDHMGAVGDVNYIRAVTRTWMIGAVKRIYEPGCQFDNMLVLTGPQGAGKSRLGRILSRGWFTDSLTKMDNSKDSYEGLEGSWIVEVAELAAAKRANMESIKNFITKERDKYRKAYGRRPGEYPRQCVFYGTTNDDEFLRDVTGARRFWPVEVQKKDRGRLRGLTDWTVAQLWGEAVAAYKNGELCMLSDDMEAVAEDEQARYAVQDQTPGEVEMYLDTPLPANWYEMSKEDRRGFFAGYSLIPKEKCTLVRDRVSIAEIRWELYGEGKSKSRGYDTISGDVGKALRLLGWKRGTQRRLAEYGRQITYYRPGSEKAERMTRWGLPRRECEVDDE